MRGAPGYSHPAGHVQFQEALLEGKMSQKKGQ